ncbi:PREDICTED: kinesin-like protein KIN-12E [Camelina sativa]|uniref:Kinesin-like protein KIN-12E n=1 Tax=Camelina sativa TaxID=90675 RepID=A0ABM0TJ02_CAMSA|nr:PREDICTED: kinesin-like protein KIN-12E [Camelina sativa]
MPFISETASAIKRRFGFNDRPVPSESFRSVPCTPEANTVSRENHTHQPSIYSSAVRSMSDLDEDGAICAGSAQISRSQSFEFNEDPAFWKDHNVQVIIRTRPLSSSEISTQGNHKCVRQDNGQAITWIGNPESRFTFDLVADENVTQEQMFQVAGVPMVENVVGGYNSCMFAYGQTGSGKTHTMLGDIEGGTRRHSVNCGITPRVFEYLFSRIQKEKEVRKEEKLHFTCRCSFLEIYNEQILDLLDPSSCNLQLREDHKKGIHVENLKEIEVSSARDVIQQLMQGAANRKVAATNMNRASSRSHSVFTCIIESKWVSQGVTHHRFARLNLVDLAGSERQKSSGAEGERLKEATNINKSLSTLGLVIMNLVSVSNGKSVHVPYRDSKLTFLLQDSLGGNSKTIIIANISPSSSCSLETLSTLKFAQRAKLIKNNAIVNEDASGDVIAMRLQIQQLKKEVSRLRGMVNGGVDNQDMDTVSMGCPASPMSLKWDGFNGSFTPLTTHKRMSKVKDYEVALVGAFRREREKDASLQALSAENEASMKLEKKREDEIRGLKMMLKLRDSAIKSLQGLASGKISVEAHLQKEKGDLMKEIEVLRAQVDRNQEVTKFATENLRLKEEIRRLKSQCEEGERDILNQQIQALQAKLLEALDWKLMHESDSSMVKEAGNISNMFCSNQNEESKKLSSIQDENEFLRMQAIQNRAEMESLQKSISFSLDEKERLQKLVDNLSKELEGRIRSSGMVGDEDQMEVQTMVQAIACASQREAEAHETAIKLAKENDDLRQKIKVLIEDNNKLIELYEQVAAENSSRALVNTGTDSSSNNAEAQKSAEIALEVEKNAAEELKKMIGNLETQLSEMHDENEKLMSLYENAMKEKDEFKRLLSSPDQEKPIEVDGDGANCSSDTEMELCGQLCNNSSEKSTEDLNSARLKLELAQEKLSVSAKTIGVFSSLEENILDIIKLSKESKETEDKVKKHQYELGSIKTVSDQTNARKEVAEKKLAALRCSLSNFASSAVYFQQREERARAHVNSSSDHLNRKNEELDVLRSYKREIDAAMGKIQQSEAELKSNIVMLKIKVDEENKRHEEEKVLCTIDNIEKINTPQRNILRTGKATDLLKSQEEKTKLQSEMKLSREKLASIRKEVDDMTKKSLKLEKEIKTMETEIEKSSKTRAKSEMELENTIQEKQTIQEVEEQGISEIQNMIIEIHQLVFESDLRKEEALIVREELNAEELRAKDMHKTMIERVENALQTLEKNNNGISGKIEEEVESVLGLVHDASRLLEVSQ